MPALIAGFDNHVAKPVAPLELLAVLATLAGHRHKPREAENTSSLRHFDNNLKFVVAGVDRRPARSTCR